MFADKGFTALTVCMVLIVLATTATIGAAVSEEVPGIILDTDFRSDVDDAGTLALLNALADNGECALLGVMASQTGPYVVGAINAVNTWYGRGDVPIGLSPVDDQRFDDYYAPAIGDPENYPSTQSNATAADSTTLYRRLLHTADDGSVIIVVIGGQTCIHRLLISPTDPEGDGSIGRTGRELIEAKVRTLVIMGGNFVDPNHREHNIALDLEAASAVAESWPTLIVYSGFEIGRPVMTGGSLTNPRENPVAKAYELYPAGGVGTIASSSSYDQTALYYAVQGTRADERVLWQLSDPGWVRFPEARTRFVRNAWGRHRHLIRHASNEEVAAVIEGLMIQPPRRQGRPVSRVRPSASREHLITDYGATPPDASRRANRPELSYQSSWLGNTFSGTPGWVPHDIDDIFVAADGTVYTNVRWEENRNNVIAVKDGRYIAGISPFDFTGGGNVPRSVGKAITGNDRYIFYSSADADGSPAEEAITRRDRKGHHRPPPLVPGRPASEATPQGRGPGSDP